MDCRRNISVPIQNVTLIAEYVPEALQITSEIRFNGVGSQTSYRIDRSLTLHRQIIR